MVDGRRVTTGTVTQRHARPTRRRRAREAGGSSRTYVDRPRAGDGADQGPLRLARRRGPRRRDRVRPAALQRRLRRRRLDARPRAARHDRHIAQRARRPARRSRARARATRATTSDLLEHTYDALRPGNVVQQAHTRLTGRADHRDLTLALGFAQRASQALAVAHDSLDDGFDARRRRLQAGLGRLPRAAARSRPRRCPSPAAYETLAARAQGPRGQGQPGRVRRLPEHAVGLGRADDRQGQPALGAVPPRLGARPLPDRHGAARGGRQGARQPRARLPVRPAAARRRLVPAEHPGRRQAQVDGHADGPAGAADRARLAARAAPARPTGRTSARPPTSSSRRARSPSRSAGRTRRATRRATIAAEIAGPGLRGGHRAPERRRHARRRSTSARPTRGQRNVERWTATRNGPYSPQPYYLRLTKDRKPGQGHEVRDRRLRPVGRRPARASSTSASSSSSGSASSAPTTRSILNTLQVVDAKLKAGGFWHRFSFDGYGEQRNGGAVAAVRRRHAPDARARVADLRRRARRVRAARRPPGERAAAGDGGRRQRRRDAPGAGLGRPRADRANRASRQGEGTFSATPLAWTHAQLVRLAWSAESGHAGRAPEGRRRSYSADGAKRYPSLPTSRRCGVFLCRPAH